MPLVFYGLRGGHIHIYTRINICIFKKLGSAPGKQKPDTTNPKSYWEKIEILFKNNQSTNTAQPYL